MTESKRTVAEDGDRFSYVRRNYEDLCRELRTFAEQNGKAPATLVCVTKSGTDEELLALAKAGAHDMAENRPQELVRRQKLLAEAGFHPIFHEIGNLQTNKVKSILGAASLIHSVGSLSLAEEIEKRSAALGVITPILMEVNSGREENKGGVFPEEAEALFLKLKSLPHLSVRGLMTMSPASENPEDARPYFRTVKVLFDRLRAAYGFDTDTPILSMGMSDTYRVALEEGSTLVRVGRKLFFRTEKEKKNV